MHTRLVVAVLVSGPAAVLGLASACGGGDGGSATGTQTADGAAPDGGPSPSATTTSPSGTPSGCAAYPGVGFCDDFENETPDVFEKNWDNIPYAPVNDQFVIPQVTTSDSAYSPSHVMHTDAEFVLDAGSAGQRFSLIGRGLPTLLLTQAAHRTGRRSWRMTIAAPRPPDTKTRFCHWSAPPSALVSRSYTGTSLATGAPVDAIRRRGRLRSRRSRRCRDARDVTMGTPKAEEPGSLPPAPSRKP